MLWYEVENRELVAFVIHVKGCDISEGIYVVHFTYAESQDAGKIGVLSFQQHLRWLPDRDYSCGP